ncbi:exo-alpha-sialidase [soil metagenome]
MPVTIAKKLVERSMKMKPNFGIRFIAVLFIVSFLISASPIEALADGDVVSDPRGFSQWTVMGPDGGDVRSVAIDPRNKDRVYLSTLDGQIYTSADAGRTWRLLVSLEQPQLIIDDLLVDLRDSDRIYASGHRHKAAGGFFMSKDGGRTWKESKDLRKEAIHAMTQSPSDPDLLFVGTPEGVWLSKNSGDSWEKISSSSMPINVNSLAIDPLTPSIIYAGTWWRPYKSTDNGNSWRLIKDGMIDDSDIFAITINEKNRNHIIASACSGIYESMNGGEQWRKIQGIPSTARRTRDIVQHPSRPGTFYAATTEGFWMSVNGGSTWSMTTAKSLEINSIAIHPEAPDRVIIGTNVNGVMISNDGGRNFSQANRSFTSRFAYSITPDIAQRGRLYATTHNTASSGGFFCTSDDGGNSWTTGRGLDSSQIAPFAVLQDRVDPNRMFLGSNLGLHRSLDRGQSWNLLTEPKPPARAPARRMTVAQRRAATAAAAKAAAAAAVAKAAAAAANEPAIVPALTDSVKVLAHTEDDKNGIFAATDKGLYRSHDIAKGWEKLEFGQGINTNVFAIHVSPLVPGTIWVGTATSGVIVSRDDGKTWERVAGKDSPPVNVPVTAIATDPKRPNYIYVGTTQSLYLSRDGGRSWTRRGGNLPLGKYTSILIDPENTDQIFVASSLESDGGIYYSGNAGMQWTRVDSRDMNVPSRRVWAMAFDPADPKRIFAASHSSGIYRIDRLQAVAGADKPKEVASN